MCMTIGGYLVLAIDGFDFVAGAPGIEPGTFGFGDRRSTS